MISQIERSKTGIALIDDLLIDDLPSAISIGILGPPGTGKTLLCRQFVCEALKRGQTAVYIALDDLPEGIRELIARSGFELEAFEREGRFFILDGYSAQVEMRSSEKYSWDSRNLLDLSVTISKALQEGRRGATTVILDRLNTLIQLYGVADALKFLHMFIAKMRSGKARCLIKVNSAELGPTVVAAVQDEVDGVVETKIEEAPEGVNYYIRVLKMRGARHLTTWTPYIIDPKLGLLKGKG